MAGADAIILVWHEETTARLIRLIGRLSEDIAFTL